MVFFIMEDVVVGFKRNSVCSSSWLYTCHVNIGLIYLWFINKQYGNYYFTINASFFEICSGSIVIYTSHPSNAIVNLPLNSARHESVINAGHYVHEMWVRLHNYYITFGNISDNKYSLDYRIAIYPTMVRASNEAGKVDHRRTSENLMLPSVII